MARKTLCYRVHTKRLNVTIKVRIRIRSALGFRRESSVVYHTAKLMSRTNLNVSEFTFLRSPHREYSTGSEHVEDRRYFLVYFSLVSLHSMHYESRYVKREFPTPAILFSPLPERTDVAPFEC